MAKRTRKRKKRQLAGLMPAGTGWVIGAAVLGAGAMVVWEFFKNPLLDWDDVSK